jgi:hypothetical protein
MKDKKLREFLSVVDKEGRLYYVSENKCSSTNFHLDIIWTEKEIKKLKEQIDFIHNKLNYLLSHLGLEYITRPTEELPRIQKRA